MIDFFRFPNPGKFLIISLLISMLLAILLLSIIGAGSIYSINNLNIEYYIIDLRFKKILSYQNVLSINTMFLPFSFILIIVGVVILRPIIINNKYSVQNAGELLQQKLGKILLSCNINPKIELKVSSSKSPTQIYRFWNPIILISKEHLQQCTMEEIEAILTHEIAHYLNKDIFLLEILNAFLYALVSQFVFTIAFLILIYSKIPTPLPDYMVNKTLYVEIINIVDVNILTFIILFVSIIVIFMAIKILSIESERRADVRVKLYFPNYYDAIIKIISKGTKKTNLFEKILFIGQERWTRHETLLDYKRLIRPNIGFAILYGLMWGLFNIILTGYFFLQYIEDLYYPFKYYLLLIFIIMNLFFTISLSTWLISCLLSWNIFSNLKIGVISIIKFFFWYTLIYSIICAGFEVISILLRGSINVFDFIFGCIIYFLTYSFLFFSFIIAFPIQKVLLKSYLMGPIIKHKVAFWIIYFPILLSYIIIIFPSLFNGASYNNLSMKNFIYFLIESAFSNNALDISELMVFIYQTSLEYFRSISISKHLFICSLEFTVVLFLFYFLVNCLNKCPSCGTEINEKFSIQLTCEQCDFPIGNVITIRDFPVNCISSKSSGGLITDYIRNRVRYELIACTIVFGALIVSEVISYLVFSSAVITMFINSWVIRLQLSVISFFLCFFVLIKLSDRI